MNPEFSCPADLASTKEALQYGPNAILATAYDDIACTSGTMRFNLHRHVVATLQEKRRPPMYPKWREFAGVVVRDDHARNPSTHFALSGTSWPAVLFSGAQGTVPIVHQRTNHTVNDQWYAQMVRAGMLGMEARRHVPVAGYNSPETVSKMTELAEIAAKSQKVGLFPIVGPIISRDGDHTAGDCIKATSFALGVLNTELQVKSVQKDMMGVQMNMIMQGRENDADYPVTSVAESTADIIGEEEAVSGRIPLVCAVNHDLPTELSEAAFQELGEAISQKRSDLAVYKLFHYSPEKMFEFSQGT